MRVLIVSTVGLKYEGITSVILANLRVMDQTGLELHVAGTMEMNETICEEVKSMGCTLVEFPHRKNNTMGYFKALTKYIRTHKIDVIHAHGNSATLAIEMMAAFLGGCRYRFAHSHNTCCEQVRADKLLRPLFYMLCNGRLACGKEAGEWLFGHRSFTIISNGRDMERYQYDEYVRNQIRQQYGFEKRKVIGHIGGFLPQKNHEFLLDILKKVHEIDQDTCFVLIGDGELRSDIEKKAESLGIKDVVKFMGLVNNVPDMLQAMDGMLLPSKFEGLPLVAVEWQMAALPCVLSDCITKDCAFTDLVEFCSIQDDPEIWAKRILVGIETKNRAEYATKVQAAAKTAGFDIRDNAALLRKMYLHE